MSAAATAKLRCAASSHGWKCGTQQPGSYSESQPSVRTHPLVSIGLCLPVAPYECPSFANQCLDEQVSGCFDVGASQTAAEACVFSSIGGTDSSCLLCRRVSPTAAAGAACNVAIFLHVQKLLPPAKFAAPTSLNCNSPFIMMLSRPCQLRPQLPWPVCPQAYAHSPASQRQLEQARCAAAATVQRTAAPLHGLSMQRPQGHVDMQHAPARDSNRLVRPSPVWLHRSASSTVRVVGLSEASSCAALRRCSSGFDNGMTSNRLMKQGTVRSAQQSQRSNAAVLLHNRLSLC